MIISTFRALRATATICQPQRLDRKFNLKSTSKTLITKPASLEVEVEDPAATSSASLRPRRITTSR